MFRLYRLEVLTSSGWHVRRHLTSVEMAKALNLIKGDRTVLDVRARVDPPSESVTEFPDGPFVGN